MPIFQIFTNAKPTDEQLNGIVEKITVDVVEKIWGKKREQGSVRVVNEMISCFSGNREPSCFVKIYNAAEIPQEVCDGVADALVSEKFCEKDRVFIIREVRDIKDCAFYFKMAPKKE